MIIKISGCILIMISCIWLGFIKASTYRERRRELEDIIELIKLLDIEIAYKKEPLARAFEKTGNMKPCYFADVLKRCSSELCMKKSMEDAWSTAMVKMQSENVLRNEDIIILNDFALGLGKSDVTGQRKFFEPTMVRLDMKLREAIDEEHRQGKMYRGIGTAAGIVIAIILL